MIFSSQSSILYREQNLLLTFSIGLLVLQSHFFLNNFKTLFTFGCVGSLLLCVGSSPAAVRQLLAAVAPLVAEHGLSTTDYGCGAQAQLPQGTWDVPRPGIEPASPSLAGGFLTTKPSKKLQSHYLFSVSSARFPFCSAVSHYLLFELLVHYFYV